MSRDIKPRTLKVISICSVCKEPVGTTAKDTAVRHGFKRYRKRRVNASSHTLVEDSFSQEDDVACMGSGVPVLYKRYKKGKNAS